MIDLRGTIKPKSDQLNADDLIGGPLTIRITKVEVGEGEQPVSIHFDGDAGKPYKPGKSMRRVLVNLWGPDGAAYVGRSLTLYRDDEVAFGGVAVGGIRISHMSHLSRETTMALTTTKAKRKPFTVKPLAADDSRVVKAVAALVARIRDAEPSDVPDILAEDVVKAQRAWLDANKPDLAAQVNAAIEAAQQKEAA
jgi:hypothetical protein